MPAAKARAPDVTIDVTPGFPSGYFKATFGGSAYVQPNGDLDFTSFTRPIRVEMTLAKAAKPSEQYKWVKKGQFNVFSFSPTETGDVYLIDDGHYQITNVVVADRKLSFIYENLNRIAGRARKVNRYNMYLTRGNEDNVIYVIDPIIRNGGNRFL